MHNIILTAHAGVQHTDQAEATAHETSSLTLVIIVTALALIAISLAMHFIGKPNRTVNNRKDENANK
jgi:hypothetical protein